MNVSITGIDSVVTTLDRWELRRRASRSINTRVRELEKGANVRMKQTYTFKGTASSVTKRQSSTPNTLTASLNYGYQSVPLTRFMYRSIPYAPGAVGIKVKIFRKGAFKEVTGKLGYLGFLQKNSVYERLQQPTWQAGRRLPYRQLFGPSVSQMMSSPELTGYFRNLGYEPLKVQGLFE